MNSFHASSAKKNFIKASLRKDKLLSREIMTLTACERALTVNCEARLIARKGQLYTKNDVIVRTTTLNTEKCNDGMQNSTDTYLTLTIS